MAKGTKTITVLEEEVLNPDFNYGEFATIRGRAAAQETTNQ